MMMLFGVAGLLLSTVLWLYGDALRTIWS
jgi:hypothetical protein